MSKKNVFKQHIYSARIGITTVLLNDTAGHAIRSKHPSLDEGGLGYGASALDTPLLIPNDHYTVNKKCTVISNQPCI